MIRLCAGASTLARFATACARGKSYEKELALRVENAFHGMNSSHNGTLEFEKILLTHRTTDHLRGAPLAPVSLSLPPRDPIRVRPLHVPPQINSLQDPSLLNPIHAGTV